MILIVDDPDAKRVCGFTWIHWLVFDITVEDSLVKIKENSVPGVLGKNSFGKMQYAGPSPPKGSGVHNYYFKVFALDKRLGLPEESSIEEINLEIKNHILEKTQISRTY